MVCLLSVRGAKRGSETNREINNDAKLVFNGTNGSIRSVRRADFAAF